ncbi:ABC transporter substrate-binding protein [Sphingobacterium cellulitidis]|uniref:ABC transporter substrate-binding protein n=1 Tax=Sphingobacterium cellulitidis TaxID=1768011 RepID=UPI00370DB9A4
MISVQNHQQPLSGNNLKNIYRGTLAAFCMAAVLAVSSCSPKTTGGVLKNPNVYGNTGKDAGNKTEAEKKEDAKKEETVKAADQSKNIALLLPFQLNMIANQNVVEADVKRSALALDFYQGFQMGVNEAAKKTADFNIHVMDTQDNEMKNLSIAASKEIENASLIVGPVYPKEIRSFAKGNKNNKILQVNPLAATMPTEFNIANLVSLTPPIRIHMRAIAAEMMKRYTDSDVIIVFEARDSDHRNFIAGFDEEVKKINPAAKIVHVSSVSQLGQTIPDMGTAFVISGTTEKTQLRSLVNSLDSKVGQGYSVRLYGHPLWSKVDFRPYDNFFRMDPTISSESHLKVWSTEVQNFQRNYKSAFKIEPSDFAYKGYDAGRYFATLLNKYGSAYSEKVVDEKYSGIFSDYQFNYNPTWGYVNQAVKIRTYRNGSFQ